MEKLKINFSGKGFHQCWPKTGFFVPTPNVQKNFPDAHPIAQRELESPSHPNGFPTFLRQNWSNTKNK